MVIICFVLVALLPIVIFLADWLERHNNRVIQNDLMKQEFLDENYWREYR
jgi:hypothetical protein